jgi:hypothetical protein
MIIKPVRGAKTPSSNDHVLRMALGVVTLPWRIVRAAYLGVCRLVGACRSDDENRDADQLRQSRARRTLRGLPPDHVQDAPKVS